MDFKYRAIGTYVILTVGSWIICIGMEANGTASPHHPVYEVMSVLRWILLAPAALCVVGILVIQILERISDARSNHSRFEIPGPKYPPVPEKLITRDEIEKQRLEAQERKRIQAEMETSRVEEDKRRKAIERQERTAKDAADAALNDF
jgi:hypothetical protein